MGVGSKVLAKLTELQKVEPKEQRAKDRLKLRRFCALKEFRNMLRDWHPDKNPEKKAAESKKGDLFLSWLRTWPLLSSSFSRRARACST